MEKRAVICPPGADGARSFDGPRENPRGIRLHNFILGIPHLLVLFLLERYRVGSTKVRVIPPAAWDGI